MSELKIESNFSNKEIVILLSILITGSILFRVIIFPYDLPIPQDGQMYFWYANDMSLTKGIPDWGNTYFPNTLWPTFLSIFFSSFSSENVLDYMELQRAVSIGLSIITAIPIFFLCRKFVRQEYALIATSLFLFEPRLIQNSLGGLTEPMFLLLTVTAIVVYLNRRISLIYISFIILALATLTRYEAALLVVPFSLLFIWKNKNSKRIFHLIICLAIFFIIIISIDNLRSANTEANLPTISDHYFTKDIDSSMINLDKENNSLMQKVALQTINLIKYYGWLTIPLFFIFLPVGLYQFFKNRNFEKWTVLICAICLLLPSFYALLRDFTEIRYLYTQIPFLCIVAAIAIEFFIQRIKKPKIMTVLFITGIILVGGIFYSEQTSMNYELEMEYLEIAKKINKNMQVSNQIFPVGKYIRSANIVELNEFPVLRDSFDLFYFEIIKNKHHNSLEKLLQLGKEKNLEYLIIDSDGDGIDYLHDLFKNEEKYPFLEKTYDSKLDGFTYHVKFFKINYDIFNKYYG
tara:strand:+ start:493 stop:2049 length:1557 start_codon:yes stop_codon:yes gene_type:complete